MHEVIKLMRLWASVKVNFPQNATQVPHRDVEFAVWVALKHGVYAREASSRPRKHHATLVRLGCDSANH